MMAGMRCVSELLLLAAGLKPPVKKVSLSRLQTK